MPWKEFLTFILFLDEYQEILFLKYNIELLKSNIDIIKI